MNISSKTYELIGRLSIEFNRLQFFTAYLFNAFEKSTKTGFFILENTSFPKLLHKIETHILELQLGKDDELALLTLLENINKCRLERNKYVHSLISKKEKDLSEKAIIFFDSIKKNKTIIKEIDHMVLENLIKETRDLGMQTIYATANIEAKVNKTGV